MTLRKSIGLVAFAILLGPGIVNAQEARKQGKQLSPAELLELSKPGPEHQRLDTLVGLWKIAITMGPNVTYQGVAECRMTTGNRFLRIEYETKEDRGALEGVFHIGFDRRHGHYTLIAMDSFGTYFVTSKGKPDQATGKVKMYGKDDDPVMKARGFTKEFVHVLDIRGKDEFAVEVWFVDTRTAERREQKAMEHIFKRTK